ncbi:THUMP domain-containing protein 3 [Entomortierella chlamydospora]|uniref:THUMP domain-containing protein 3 n=1 Tax=Entomortierella chlamydospora TaxID=101097 RepID=A0A9P6MZ05_9FUNG|nr:THUMP domain-containing protein 3 [Entomortierella chlamydospora]
MHSSILQAYHDSAGAMNITANPQQEHQSQLKEEKSIQLFLSVPGGLEDVVVCKLPTLLVEAAGKISYRIGSGYLTVNFFVNEESFRASNTTVVTRVIADLVQHPPPCIFAAYVSIGTIAIPRKIFDSSKDLLVYVLGGFRRLQQQEQCGKENDTCSDEPAADLGLSWHEGLSVLGSTPSPLAKRLNLSISRSGQDPGNLSGVPSMRFRASFDRGDVQHKGVRSQDIAAGLGGVTGKVFSSWSVDLKDYDIEVMGRWIQEDLEEVDFKLESPEPASGDNSDGSGVQCPLECSSNKTSEQGCMPEEIKMQVGMTLPLALSTCPYRFRPMDGRTSLKIEIAYSLLAMANPKPGNVVLDMCSGVGTIPIVGAAHYPECHFTGLEVVPFNVEKAGENSKAMIERVNQERLKSGRCDSISSSPMTKEDPLARCPCLLVGDARAVCWRSKSIDLIISDLPWGQRESSHLSNCKLYPKLVKEIIRLLKVNGRALLVTGERRLLQRQLDSPFAKPHLKLLQKREITIGFKVMVFELERV